MPDGDSNPQHVRTSSFLLWPRSSELAQSPSLPRPCGNDCRYTSVPSRPLTVLKSHWSLSSSPLTAPNWYVSRHYDTFLCDRSSAPVMTLSCYGAWEIVCVLLLLSSLFVVDVDGVSESGDQCQVGYIRQSVDILLTDHCRTFLML